MNVEAGLLKRTHLLLQSASAMILGALTVLYALNCDLAMA